MNVMNMPNVAFLLLIAVAAFAVASAFSPSLPHQFPPLLLSSPLQSDTQTCLRAEVEDDDVSLEAFQARKRRNEEQNSKDDLEEFDGYAMRDVILEKWGKCFDVDFNRVDSFGFKNLYLNVVPFHLGGRRFRHETELDYLCHLQAVVEVLQKYDQLGYVLAQIAETNKKPRAGTSPLVAVPLRLDLSREQVDEILGY